MEIVWAALCIMSILSVVFYFVMTYYARIYYRLINENSSNKSIDSKIFVRKADLFGSACQFTMTVVLIVFILVCIIDFSAVQFVFFGIINHLSFVSFMRFCVFLLPLCVSAYSALKWFDVLLVYILSILRNKK